MGHMKPVARLDDNDTHRRGSRQRPDGQSHVQAEVAIARTEVDKVAHTHGDDTTHGHDGQQSPRDVEDGGESHGRHGGSNGILPILMMGCHGERLGKIVDAADLDGKGDAEGHGQQRIDGTDESGLDIAVEHVAHKVDEWHARYDE